MAPLLLAFTVIPLIELYLLLALSRVMGVFPTVLLVLLTGVIGASLARAEGLRVLRGFQQAVAAGRVPEDGVVSAVLVLVGGVLLVTPGVLTDACGLLLLIPATRRALSRWVSRRVEAGIANGRIHVVSGVVSGVDGRGASRPPASPFGVPFGARGGSHHSGPDAGHGARHGRPRVIEVKARVIDSEPSDSPSSRPS